MNAGNVAAFACGRAHPQLGDAVPCMRSRHHGGDHRGQDGDTLKTWQDPPLAEAGEPTMTAAELLAEVHAKRPRVIPLPLPELDESTEEWLEAAGRGGVWLIVDDLTRVALLVLAVLAAAAAPALLVLLYRLL